MKPKKFYRKLKINTWLFIILYILSLLSQVYFTFTDYSLTEPRWTIYLLFLVIQVTVFLIMWPDIWPLPSREEIKTVGYIYGIERRFNWGFELFLALGCGIFATSLIKSFGINNYSVSLGSMCLLCLYYNYIKSFKNALR